MRRLSAWTMIVMMVGVAGLMSGCQEQKEEPAAQAPVQEPVERFPEAQVPPAEPQPATTATLPPPPPVDTSAEQPAARSSKPKAQPKESYASGKKSTRSYTVKKGDTLQKISQKFYGTTKKWRQIYEANRKVVKDPDKLTVGTKLTIP
jgi:nucleoid-associated protein YgaU